METCKTHTQQRKIVQIDATHHASRGNEALDVRQTEQGESWKRMRFRVVAGEKDCEVMLLMISESAEEKLSYNVARQELHVIQMLQTSNSFHSIT